MQQSQDSTPTSDASMTAGFRGNGCSSENYYICKTRTSRWWEGDFKLKGDFCNGFANKSSPLNSHTANLC